MTISKLNASTDEALGFKVSGDVTTADYEVLNPAVEEAVDRRGTIRLLLDLTEFHREKISAWGSDLRFGHRYHDTIDRLAIVGNRSWERHLAQLASPFYARESAFFETEADAWAWLRE